MIEGIDRRLKEWVQALVPNANVLLTPPTAAAGQTAVCLHLTDLLPSAASTSGKRPAFSVSLRYRVTTWGQDTESEHRLLDVLLMAASQRQDFELELGPTEPVLWQALGLAPRPSFILRVRAEVERPLPDAGRILQPPIVRSQPIAGLTGRVLGPGHIPLAEAQVEVPGFGLSARTDIKGWFHFATVPADPEIRQLRIRARGVEQLVEVQRPEDAGPVIIHLKFKEL